MVYVWTCRYTFALIHARSRARVHTMARNLTHERETIQSVVPLLRACILSHTHIHRHTLSLTHTHSQIYELIQACSKAMPHITSTSDLPARIPDFHNDGRSLVIHELYTTEYTYVTGLEVLCEVGLKGALIQW